MADKLCSQFNFRLKIEFALESIDSELENKINAAFEKKFQIKPEKFLRFQNQKLSRMIISTDTTKPYTINDFQTVLEQCSNQSNPLTGLGISLSAAAKLCSDYNLTFLGETQSLSMKPITGVVRIAHIKDEFCILDCLICNLPEDDSCYQLNIREGGDIRGPPFDRLGRIYLKIADNLKAKDGRINFKQTFITEDLESLFGRTFELSAYNQIIAVGILARAALVSENEKTFCPCSGKTMFQERDNTRRLQ